MRRLTTAPSEDRLPAARDRRDDRDLVAVLELAPAPVQEAHVLLVHVDVDELPEVTRLVAEAVAEPGILAIQIVDQLADVLALGVHLSRPAGVPPGRRGNAHG